MTGQASAARPRAEALYVLSFLGAHLGFMPLLMLLLPRRVMAIAPDHSLGALSALLLLGGLVASLAHIAAGAVGDAWLARHGNRRGVIAAGLLGLVGAYALMAIADTIALLAAGVVCFQVTLNLMFAPLGALMTDYIPDARKGRIAGWLNAALPLSILMVAGLARIAPLDNSGSFLVVAAIVAALVLPLLVFWPFGPRLSAPTADAQNGPVMETRVARRDLLLAWGARLLMQMGASLLVNYIYLYLASLSRASRLAGMPDASQSLGWLSLVASGMAVIGAVVAGHGSDAGRRRRTPMIIAALTAAMALMLLARPISWGVVLLAYGLFQAALTAYLAIDSAMVAQIVGWHPRRGAYLGLMNLTNTLPGVISAILALISVARAPDSAALPRMVFAFAAASLAAAILVSRIRSLK